MKRLKNIHDINVFGQLTLTDYADTITTDISMSYNAIGQLLTVSDAKGTTTFTYNEYGDVISENINGIYQKQFKNEYDSFGDLIQDEIPNEYTLNHTYDDMKRQATLQLDNQKIICKYLDNSDLLEFIENGNGLKTAYIYDENRDLLKHLTHRGSHKISRYDYTHDDM